MSKVSVGYFEPDIFQQDVERMSRKVVSRMTKGEGLSGRATDPRHPLMTRRIRTEQHPLMMRENRKGAIASWVAIARPLGMAVNPNDYAGGSFHFVLFATNRPGLLTAPTEGRSRQVMAADAPIGTPLPLALIELEPGLAVHFDPSSTYSGIVPLPHMNDPLGFLSCATVMVRVDGFEATEIEQAITFAADAVALDRPYWDRPDGFIMPDTVIHG